jgi:hypothetical protein
LEYGVDKLMLETIEDALKVSTQVDLSLHPSMRPLTGMDIDFFRGRHELANVEVIHALCIQNSASYNEIVRYSHLKYDMEMLLRLYELEPEPWKSVGPGDIFHLMYGDILEQFRGTSYEKDAKTALYLRFTAGCGRSVFSGYRWIEKNGSAKRGVMKIFSKLAMMDNPRQVFEDLARQMYKVRGFDFDEFCPMPTLDNPPLPKKRGPPVKDKTEKVKSSGSKATGAKRGPKPKNKVVQA